MLKPNDGRKLKKCDERHRGKLDIETGGAQKMLRDRGRRNIETKCMREIAERHMGAGEIRILKQHKRKKLWRGQRGETYI